MQIQPFNFAGLHDFRKPAEPKIEEVEEVSEEKPEEAAPPPPPTFSEEQLEAAKKEVRDQAYQEGVQAGLQQAENEQVKRARSIEHMLDDTVRKAAQLQADYERVLESQVNELGRFILAIARKVAGDALKDDSATMVEAMVQGLLPVVMDQPRLVLHVHEDIAEEIACRVSEKLEKAGYEGDFDVRPDANLPASDAKLEWGNGFGERDTEKMWHEIEAVLAHMDMRELLAKANEIEQEDTTAAPAPAPSAEPVTDAAAPQQQTQAETLQQATGDEITGQPPEQDAPGQDASAMTKPETEE